MPGGAAPGSPLAPTLTPTRCTGAGERGVGATISRPLRGQAGNGNKRSRQMVSQGETCGHSSPIFKRGQASGFSANRKKLANSSIGLGTLMRLVLCPHNRKNAGVPRPVLWLGKPRVGGNQM